MVRSKVTRGRRKLPVAARMQMAAACRAAIVGYELCAERSPSSTTVVAARNAATNLRALLLSLDLDASADRAPRRPLGDRLRWEWLASTGTVLDGAPDARLLAECARILRQGRPTDGDVVDARALVARYLVASAEAYSLASALVPVAARGALAFT